MTEKNDISNIYTINLKKVEDGSEMGNDKFFLSKRYPFWKFFLTFQKRLIESKELLPNKLKNRVCVCTYNANLPIEDYHNAIQLKSMDGYLLSILDGHGGIEMAKYANKKLHLLFDNYLSSIEEKLSLFENIRIVLSRIYKTIEEEFFLQALENWKNGYGKLAFVGTCVITIVVNNSNLYIANLGDSKARLFKNIEGIYSSLKISKTFNANKISERVRLSHKIKDDNLFSTNDGINFYVKGRLIPTRV